MMSNGSTFNPQKPSTQQSNDIKQPTQPESTFYTPEVSGNIPSSTTNTTNNIYSTRKGDSKLEITSTETLVKDSISFTESCEKPNTCNVSSVTLINNDSDKEKCSVEGLKTKLLISSYDREDTSRHPRKTSDNSANNIEYKNKCVIQINENVETALESPRKNKSQALPDIIDDIQTNKTLAKTKNEDEINIGNKSSSNFQKYDLF